MATKHYEKWKRNFDLAKEYYKKNGTINVPRSLEYKGFKLGQWVQVQRLAKNGIGNWKITQKQINMLERLDIDWTMKPAKVSNSKSKNALYMQLAHNYFDEYGDLLVPIDYVVENMELGKWIHSLRQSFRSVDEDIMINNPKLASSMVSRLSEKNIRLLNEMDMLWREESKNDWDYKFLLAKSYYENNGNLLIPSTYIANDEMSTHLGNWIRYNRQLYLRNSDDMSNDHIDKLNSIGMVWNIRDNLWEEKFALAKKYYQENGNLKVPRDFCEDGINLGNWIVWQRQAKKGNVRNSLSIERIELLDSIGMVWEIYPQKIKNIEN